MKIEFEIKSELGDIEIKYIIFEMMGRYSNIFLVDFNYKIIDVIKRLLFEDLLRLILFGVKYILLLVLIKKNFIEVLFEEFVFFFKFLNKSLENILIDNFLGISK